MKRPILSGVALAVVLSLSAGATALAQPALKFPDASPKATVTQTVGMTDIAIAYNRPAVNKRKIWGGLVPYKEVWRAGANENTTISFSSPVTVAGKPLAAGTYGLHMLPTETDWTIAFSTQHNAWGSFSYDAKEDAARITVSPRPAEFAERLSYRFDDPTENSVTGVMHWEKLEVPFAIAVDTKAVTLASIREQLRGLPRFFWQGWNQAARWALRNDGNIDEALAWSDESLKINENFQNLRVKAGLLEKKGDAKAASALRERSLKLATEVDMNAYGYQLLGEKKVDEALDVFKKNVKDHPGSWNVYDSLAEGYAAKGDKKLAIELYIRALQLAPEAQKKRINGAIGALKG
jgi:tetratricopeptide (TPR) repeat protein